jgi:hypothetical protein
MFHIMEPQFHIMRLGSRSIPVKRISVTGGPMFVNRMPRYEVLSEDAMATH